MPHPAARSKSFPGSSPAAHPACRHDRGPSPLRKVRAAGWLLCGSLLLAPGAPAAAAPSLAQQVEEDWIRQAEAWQKSRQGDCNAPGQTVSTRADAAGGCDGVKNGRYAFHTGLEPNPWWQVDLGRATAIERVVVYNRLDYAPGLHNADTLRLFTSPDGQAWTLRHANPGRHFGGVSGAPPLEVRLASPVDARYVRLQIPSAQPIFFHLDEVEVYGPGPGATNMALHGAADQSSVSQWSVSKPRPGTSAPQFPIAESVARGRQLARDLAHAGVRTEELEGELDALEQRARALGATQSTAPPAAAARALYLQVRRVIRRMAFRNPLLDFERLLFVQRFTQESYPDICLNHMPWVSRPGGDICLLRPSRAGERLFGTLADLEPEAEADRGATVGSGAGEGLRVERVLQGALGPGHVHGLDMWWDANRVVFGYARARSGEPPEGWLDRTRSYALRRSEEPIHLFEVGLDGRGLRQLTTGEWSDLDPSYLPNGNVVFVSERCGTSLQCNEYDKDETSCNLYVMGPDGANVRRLSANKDGDYLPHTLDNGWIAYTRWEYHERSWALIQSIWVVRPDGTGADAIFKQHFVNPWALEDARSIPGSAKLVAIAAGHHTLAVGPLVVVDHGRGINDPRGISIVTPGVSPPEGGMDGVPVPEGGVTDCGGFYSTPWALSEKYFLAAYTYGKERDPSGYALYLIDVFGNKELVHRDPAISCFLPIPVRPRPRPPVVTEVATLTNRIATCLVTDASFGADGLTAAQVRYLRIAEPVGWPYDNLLGGQRYGEDHRFGGPAADRQNLVSWTPIRILGDVPIEADGSAYFQVPADTAVYFQLLDEQRRELRRMRSFISFQPGELRSCTGCHESRASAPVFSRAPLAARRAPSVPAAPPWGDQPVSFLRDIQPVLDHHCVRCHSGLKPKGRLDFSAGLTSHDPEIPGYGYNRAFETILENNLVCLSQVRAQDASITPALAYGSHRSRLLTALANEPHAQEVRLSEEDRLRLTLWIDANAPYHDRFVNKRPPARAYDMAADRELSKELERRHAARCSACHSAAQVTRLDWIDLREPARSLFLLAPLARSAGGLGKCSTTVYAGTTDPDYQAILQRVRAAARRATTAPRRDVQSLDVAGGSAGF